MLGPTPQAYGRTNYQNIGQTTIVISISIVSIYRTGLAHCIPGCNFNFSRRFIAQRVSCSAVADVIYVRGPFLAFDICCLGHFPSPFSICRP
jgi:hypothetical protein